MAKIGVQAMVLKDDFAALGPFETLRRVSDIGYHAVEVSQIPMTSSNVAELERARAELGMDIASLSAGLTTSLIASEDWTPNDGLDSQFDKIVGDCRTLGVSMVRLAETPFDAMSSRDAVLEFCDSLNATAQRLKEAGIDLSYHHHHFEFAKYGTESLLELVLERAPLVGLEIDVHWVQRGGFDPASLLRKYAGRVPLVHLKDYRIVPPPEGAVAAIAAGEPNAFMTAGEAVVQFAEVGEGNLDFRGIIEASLEIGAGYLLVEQDDRYGRTAMECLQTSYDNLVALGYADLF